MNSLQKTGRLFYGLAIMAYGVQQIVIHDFRPQILPLFPAWAHQYSFFALVTGAAMILLGAVAAGFVKMAGLQPGRVCLYVGFYFFALIITCQIPYLLFIFPHKLSHLGVWADLLKELAFCGGSFVLAAVFSASQASPGGHSFEPFAGKLMLVGRIFFCTTLILFGRSHFVYHEFISQMVPGWFGMPGFWTYFSGVALIGAGVAIALKLFLKPVLLLLAVMLFLWFLLLHVPGAMANPAAGRGNAIVSAFDALLFCGTALVLSQYKKEASVKATDSNRSAGVLQSQRVRV